jgi:hypothetical protein
MKKMTFEEWKVAVNKAIEERVGLSADDLPDQDYAVAWSEGMTPKLAAIEAIRAAKEF